MKISLINKDGIIKEVKLGFSWTTLFFGIFPALLRKDFKWAMIMLFLSVTINLFAFGLGALLTSSIFAFIYNKIYIKNLLTNGYRPVYTTDREILIKKQLLAA